MQEDRNLEIIHLEDTLEGAPALFETLSATGATQRLRLMSGTISGDQRTWGRA